MDIVYIWFSSLLIILDKSELERQWSFLQLRSWLPSLWMGVRLELTLLWYKCCCFSNVIHFVIMPTTYWSLSQQGHLQPYSKSKAWQLSTQLWSGLSGSWDVFVTKPSYLLQTQASFVNFVIFPFVHFFPWWTKGAAFMREKAIMSS